MISSISTRQGRLYRNSRFIAHQPNLLVPIKLEMRWNSFLFKSIAYCITLTAIIFSSWNLQIYDCSNQMSWIATKKWPNFHFIFFIFFSLRSWIGGNIHKSLSDGLGPTSSTLLGTLYCNPCMRPGICTQWNESSLAGRWTGKIYS